MDVPGPRPAAQWPHLLELEAGGSHRGLGLQSTSGCQARPGAGQVIWRLIDLMNLLLAQGPGRVVDCPGHLCRGQGGLPGTLQVHGHCPGHCTRGHPPDYFTSLLTTRVPLFLTECL